MTQQSPLAPRHPDPIRTICCIHQGYELYGSDRLFIQCVAILRRLHPEAAIEIVLPKPGPIVDPLRMDGVSIVFDDIWVLRKKDIAQKLLFRLPHLIGCIRAARRRIADSDLTYISTSVIADYLLAARTSPAACLCHVHESPDGLALLAVRALLHWAAIPMIFNSAATQTQFALPEAIPQAVVLNSCKTPEKTRPVEYDGLAPLKVLMLGRINSWKGQDLLVEAVAAMQIEARARIEIRIVGGTFDNARHDLALLDLIRRFELESYIEVLGFDPDPTPHYQWCDILVVPSRKPEPFGLVAIEAFSHGRAVIAADHGGLTEIVTPDRDGWRFEPNSAADLARYLEMAVASPFAVRTMGETARITHAQRFTETIFERSFAEALHPADPTAP